MHNFFSDVWVTNSLQYSNCQTKLVAQSVCESKACTSLLQAKTLACDSVFNTGLASGPARASWARARENSQPEVALLNTLYWVCFSAHYCSRAGYTPLFFAVAQAASLMLLMSQKTLPLVSSL